MKAPLLALKCKQEAFNVRFPRNGIPAAHIDPKHCCWFFVLFGICKFCDGSDIGLFMGGLRIAGKWRYYSKLQTEM